jgi:glycosyltransferase involved in cell wall biosynthesis
MASTKFENNMKQEVIFLLPSLEPGGTERNVVNLANAINKERYRALVALGKQEGAFIKELAPHVSIVNLHAFNSFALLLALVEFFKAHNSAIVVSAFPRINVIALAAKLASRSKAKIVITEHSVFSQLSVIAKTPWRRMFAKICMPFLAKALYPKADAIVCVSQGIAKDLSHILGKNAKMSIAYNPIIHDTMYRLAEAPVEHPWFLDSGIPIILAAGRLVACKDYPTLLKAFALALKSRPARLVILGDGSEREALKHLAVTLGISDKVAFLGFQKNPYAYMKKASLFVLSSLQEGFGNVIIEAMACGVPVVSTDCPVGPGEIITHEKDGLVVPMANPEALSQAMLRILDDALLQKKFSEAGKIRAASFSVARGVAEYEKIFQAL